MGEKKKSSNIWKLAGEPIYPDLSKKESESISEMFQLYSTNLFKELQRRNMLPVPAATSKLRENAAKASASYFCGRFADRYGREAVIHALGRAVSLPTMRAEHLSQSPSFLLGAAIWILDHVKENCDEDLLFSFLPPEPDEDLEDLIPEIDDFSHTRGELLRLTTVLAGRNKTYRKECRKVLSLIEKEEASELKNGFRDVLLDYFERVLRVFRRAAPVEDEERFPDLFDILGQKEPEHIMEESHPGEYFLLCAMKLIGCSVEVIQEQLHSRKTAELLAGFTVDNPYQFCAAYLLLEWGGDALASLNVLTAAVMTVAEKHLPWAVDILPGGLPSAESGFPDHRLRYSYHGTAYDPETDQEMNVEGERMISEAQLFYLATSCLLPRNRVPSHELTDWLVRQNMPKERALALAYASMVASCVEFREDAPVWEFDDDFDGFPSGLEAAFEPTPPEGEKTAEAYEAQVSDLSRQLKEMRRALHDAEQAERKLQEQLRKREAQSEKDRAELIQLRDIVFQLNQSTEEEESSIPEVTLPWKVQRRTIIFGGHDTWLKAIRPLLPGARFFEREMLPEIDAIKGADVVWIQTNALSHKFYYRIIDAAKKGGADVRYFGFASARKCAEQLAEEEVKG